MSKINVSNQFYILPHNFINISQMFTEQELYEKTTATKHFLNKEVVKIRTKTDEAVFTSQEVHTRLDIIHESERVGIRNLDERGLRKLTKVIREVDDRNQVELMVSTLA